MSKRWGAPPHVPFSYKNIIGTYGKPTGPLGTVWSPKIRTGGSSLNVSITVNGLLATSEAAVIKDLTKIVPSFLMDPKDPRFSMYKKGRKAAFSRAEKAVGEILQDSLRQYHAANVYPYGRSLQAIRYKLEPGPESDVTPSGTKLIVGYQPTPDEDQDTITDRGVTSFMMTTIRGVQPGRIHPPWYGKWANEYSSTGAIYGPKDYAGTAGGRLGHWAMIKGILPTSKQYITKAQKNPRISAKGQLGSLGIYGMSALQAKSLYPKGMGRRQGRYKYTDKTKVQSYRSRVPPKFGSLTSAGFIEMTPSSKYGIIPGIAGGFEKETISWDKKRIQNYVKEKNIERSGLVHYNGKLYTQSTRPRKGAIKYGKTLKPLKKDYEEKLQRVGVNDKTWEYAAKLIASSLEKRGIPAKPVLTNWYNEYIASGALQQQITYEYGGNIRDWYDYVIDSWSKQSTAKWRGSVAGIVRK